MPRRGRSGSMPDFKWETPCEWVEGPRSLVHCLEIIKFLFEARLQLVQGPSCEPLRGSCMVFPIEIGSMNR